MKIICKTTLLAATPPFAGTEIDILVDDGLVFGLNRITLASDSAVVDWGDGTRETFTATGEAIHTYPAPGNYTVRISDDISQPGFSTTSATSDIVLVYMPMIRAIRFVNAQNLGAIPVSAFKGCVNMTSFTGDLPNVVKIGSSAFVDCRSLASPLHFPEVSMLSGSGGALPFTGCIALREIYFSEEYRDSIERKEPYRSNPQLGAPNAVVLFE